VAKVARDLNINYCIVLRWWKYYQRVEEVVYKKSEQNSDPKSSFTTEHNELLGCGTLIKRLWDLNKKAVGPGSDLMCKMLFNDSTVVNLVVQSLLGSVLVYYKCTSF
ncbi:hypothetical protein BDF21DRAFT_347082, partial [Thamnidium elegans]